MVFTLKDGEWIDESIPRKPLNVAFKSLRQQFKDTKSSYHGTKEWIYFFKCQNLYKIGSTKQPLGRLTIYDQIIPFYKELIFCRQRYHAPRKEGIIKRKFKKKCEYGSEWFKLSEDDIIEINKIVENRSI